MLGIYCWRLTSSTTGRQYVTRRRLSAEDARFDPNAQPGSEPEIISGYGQASTSDFMGGGPEGAPAGAVGALPSAGPRLARRSTPPVEPLPRPRAAIPLTAPPFG
jgi:hypothetical protein